MFSVHLVSRDEHFYMSDDQTILSAALEAGVRFPNRCQIGACATCLCQLIEGQVHYRLDPVMTTEEKAQGWVFACQAYPSSDLVLQLD
ncbi:2Fe-2S iron-sulfur cluster-binding protein [Veronia pacifica]|uniref:Ferredoxin n=1 Tax=Veronia pacifica TaxID=1080227 RepID=A0A1C3ECC4_9GAMM|nr:2Fe-2S iron-sulfur cluster-binding protein [Veronia pacifica]ODA30875.1 ferredoxin [Veronia pacifica]